jgi:transcriptional regulator with XRE-family HTH domain
MRDNFPNMDEAPAADDTLDHRIARRLRELRGERAWTLETLAGASGVSRTTLSRLENAEVSPTASVLGKLCAAYGLPLSRLMLLVEEDFRPLVRQEEQPVWHDASVGYRRRSVSPPARALLGEALACELDAGARIDYEAPPRPGQEHHLLLLEGRLEVAVGERTYALQPGDCLRYRLFGPSRFSTPPDSGARYHLFLV